MNQDYYYPRFEMLTGCFLTRHCQIKEHVIFIWLNPIQRRILACRLSNGSANIWYNRQYNNYLDAIELWLEAFNQCNQLSTKIFIHEYYNA